VCKKTSITLICCLVVVMGFRYLVDASLIFVGNFVSLTLAEI
jgi:hypothetical protein